MKAVSFDLWGTLVKSNSDFSFHQEALVREFTEIENWKDSKRELKTLIAQNEIRGIHTPRENVYKSFFKDFSLKELEDFINYSNELFLKYPPLTREPETDIISILRDRGIRCYISSNSTLIYGDVLSKLVYEKFGIIRKNCRFSDEVKATKPDAKMFEFPIKPDFHIGDNAITDGASVNFGIEHYHINEKQNFKTFLDYARI